MEAPHSYYSMSSLCPPAQPALTETLEIQLWENFTVCPDISQFPVQSKSSV